MTVIDNNNINFQTSDKFSLLWEISGNGVEKPSYLYGTIHMYDTNIFVIPNEAYQAIAACEVFALEVDLNESNSVSNAYRMTITDEENTLDKLLNPEIYAEIIKVPYMQILGEGANKVKPIFVSSYIMVENPMAMMSVDMNLYNYAQMLNKSIIGIETAEEQFDAIDKIPLAEQTKGIIEIYNYCQKENMTFAEAGEKIFNKLQNAYKNQDFEALENLEDDFKMTSNTPLSDATLIATRNINMANRISDHIKQAKTLFAGIGAMHLPDYKNMRGVVTLLKEKGYYMRPILINL